MKKLLSLMMLMLLCTSAWAETSTLTFTTACGGTGTADDGASWTVTSDAAESNFDSNKGIHYGTGKLAVSYLELKTNSISGTITKVKVNASGASGTSAKLDITIGGQAFGEQKNLTSAAADYEFTGSAQGEILVSLTQESATKALYVKSIAVTYDTGSDFVATPLIAFDNNNPGVNDEVTCTITCDTQGASILYALNDGEYQEYTGPFTLTETTTVKAKAELNGTKSGETIRTIQFPTTVANIAAFNGLDNNTDLTFTGTVTAIAQKGNNLYVQDSEKGMLIYGSTGQSYNFGDIIPAGFKGTKTTYNGAPEMTNPANFADATGNTAPTPIEMTIDDVKLDNFGRYGVISGATIEDGEIKVGDQTVTIAQTLGVAIPTEGTLFDIYGVVGWTNNPRFLPMKYVDKTPFALTITPANYIGTESVKVTIAPYHAAEGNVEITYTLDGSDPSLSGALTYSGPITITESCTLKAYALDAQMHEATAEGTYVIVVPATKFKLVTDLTELEAGKQVLIAGVKESTTNGKTMFVMGKQNNNNRAAVKYGAIEEAPRNLNLSDGTVTGYFPMVLGKEGNYYTFYDYNDAANKGYLFAAGSDSNNSLKKQEELNDNAKAAITLEEGVFSVVFQGNNENKYMQFNSSSTLFSCYGPSNEQEPVYLYVEGEVIEKTATPEISVTEGEEAYTVTATGAGTVKLYKDGEEVENPCTVARTSEEQTFVFTATAQEEGKDISEVATQNVTVPALPATTYTITLDKEPGNYTSLVNVKATVEPALPEGAELTFKINDADPKPYNPEKGVNMLESGTLTFTATDAAGNVLATTSAEYKYIMGVFGDLNGDGKVDVEEVDTVVNLILGKLNN